MDKMSNEDASSRWLSVPVIATVTRILCRELTPHNESLRHENKILNSKIKTRMSLNDDERRTLVDAVFGMSSERTFLVVC